MARQMASKAGLKSHRQVGMCCVPWKYVEPKWFDASAAAREEILDAKPLLTGMRVKFVGFVKEESNTFVPSQTIHKK